MSSSVHSTGDTAVNKTGPGTVCQADRGDPLQSTSKRALEICANIVISAPGETAVVETSDRLHCGAGGGGACFAQAAQPVSQAAELRPTGSGHKV